jgi:hypothetical protein
VRLLGSLVALVKNGEKKEKKLGRRNAQRGLESAPFLASQIAKFSGEPQDGDDDEGTAYQLAATENDIYFMELMARGGENLHRTSPR